MTTELITHNRSEAYLSAWGRFIVRNRWMAIVASVVFTAIAASYLPQLVVDNSTESFLHEDDAASIRYRAFRDQFDRDDRIIVALAPPDVFDVEFVRKLRQLHLALEEELPYVEDVTSLFNARSTYGDEDELIVEDLLEGWLDEWPENAEGQLAGMRERVLANPFYVNNLVSEDATLTTITIKPFTYSAADGVDVLGGFDAGDAAGDEPSPPALLTAWENDELVAKLKEVVARHASDDIPIHLGGALAITDHINRSVEYDMGMFMGLSLVVMVALLYALFGRISGSILPIVVVLLSIASTIGVMIMIGIPGSTAVQILPVFLLSVGICDAVHILTIVYQQLRTGHTQDDAIVYAIGHSGLAVVMTSVTTAAGMMSFRSATMAPIAHLGTIAPIGVMLALAYTLVLLPAVLSIVPLRPPKGDGQRSLSGALNRVLVRIGDFSADHPWSVVAGTAVFVAFFAVGASFARFSHNGNDWFEKDDPIRVASLLLDEKLRGTMSLEVVLDTGIENGLHDPDVLKRIDAASRHAETISDGELFIGKALSIVDVVKETHQALNENRADAYVVPDDREVIAQELFLFENSGVDDLEELVDSQFQLARLSLRAPFVNALLYQPFIDRVEREISPILGDDIEIEMTGFMPVLASVMSAVITSMARSYVFALLIITPIMIYLLRDFRLGVMSMIPNLVPVVAVVGLMGWMDLPIDASTMMIGAMVIGLAVDDTIHFMHKFRIYYSEFEDSKLAIRATLGSTGAALLFTSLVLTAGFGTFLFASMVNTQNFGFLAAAGAVFAFAADLLVAPALMTLATRRDQRTTTESQILEAAAREG